MFFNSWQSKKKKKKIEEDFDILSIPNDLKKWN